MRLLDYVRELEGMAAANPDDARLALEISEEKCPCPFCIYDGNRAHANGLCLFPYPDAIIEDVDMNICFDGILQMRCHRNLPVEEALKQLENEEKCTEFPRLRSLSDITPEEEAEALQRFEEARRRYASMIEKAR